MSNSLAQRPATAARMGAARLIAFPVRCLMSFMRRSNRTICRSNRTIDTLDQASEWTGGRPRRAFGRRLIRFRPTRFVTIDGNYRDRLLVPQAQPFDQPPHGKADGTR